MDLRNKKIKKYPLFFKLTHVNFPSTLDVCFEYSINYYNCNVKKLLFLTSSNNYNIVHHNYYTYNAFVGKETTYGKILITISNIKKVDKIRLFM